MKNKLENVMKAGTVNPKFVTGKNMNNMKRRRSSYFRAQTKADIK